MFANQIAGAISCAQFSDLNDLSHKLWKAHAAGQLDDATAQGLAEQLEAKRPKQGAPVSRFRPATTTALKRQRSPDKQASIERRRRLARVSPVPKEHWGEFTTSQHAVITVTIDEVQRSGWCALCIDAIAAKAGTCRTIVRMAWRKARNLGLLFVTERRRRGQKSLTNVVRVLCKRWHAWIAKIGLRKLSTTDHIFSKNRSSASVESSGKHSHHALPRWKG
jgi:hypothetical protein